MSMVPTPSDSEKNALPRASIIKPLERSLLKSGNRYAFSPDSAPSSVST